jgi:hypothetical protein
MSTVTSTNYVVNLAQVQDTDPPLRFMGRTEVAYYLGLSCLGSLTTAKLPPPDIIVGDRKGWTTDTIDAWRQTRPGRGNWGLRDAPNKEN